MKQTIVDFTKPNPLTPISLKLCLQDRKEKSFTMGDYKDFLKKATNIARLAEMNEYRSFKADESDLILVDGCLFLGQWNDGVVA